MKSIALIVFSNLLIFSQCFGQSIPTYLPTNGLIGWWPFNGNANDESGNGNHGIAMGATLASDRFSVNNKAFDFDVISAQFSQQNEEINIPNNAIFNSAEISASVWIKPRSHYWTENPNHMSIVLARYNAQGEVFRFGFNDQQLYLEIADENQTYEQLIANYSLALNSWSHLSFIVKADSLKFYVNGALISSTTHNINLNTSSASSISIGELAASNGYWYPVDGVIDDVGIWSRSLSDEEIQNLFLGISTPLENQPQANRISIYPSPASGYIKLRHFEEAFFKQYCIINADGKQIQSGIISSKDCLIDVSNLKSGLYLLKLVGNNKESVRFIKD